MCTDLDSSISGVWFISNPQSTELSECYARFICNHSPYGAREHRWYWFFSLQSPGICLALREHYYNQSPAQFLACKCYKRLVHNAHHFLSIAPMGPGVWSPSQFSLCAQKVAKNLSFLHIEEDSDQTGRMSFRWFCRAQGVTPPSPITSVNKRKTSTTNIPGIHPGRLR